VDVDVQYKGKTKGPYYITNTLLFYQEYCICLFSVKKILKIRLVNPISARFLQFPSLNKVVA